MNPQELNLRRILRELDRVAEAQRVPLIEVMEAARKSIDLTRADASRR